MSMQFKRRLPIPMEIREAMPLSLEMARRKEAFDAQVAAIIRGEDKRVLLIIGPRARPIARTPCSTTSRASRRCRSASRTRS